MIKMGINIVNKASAYIVHYIHTLIHIYMFAFIQIRLNEKCVW